MNDRLVWCDIETTGLDPDQNLLLEVGFKITDLDLRIQSQISMLIWNESYYGEACHKDKMDPYVYEMHRKSDLIAEARMTGNTPEVASRAITRWLTEQDITKNEPLCGSSVQFDRHWLEVWMPEAIAQFSYRNIDISSVKELCKRYNPILYSQMDSETAPLKMHRVLPDLDDTIDEFKFYLENFLFWKD